MLRHTLTTYRYSDNAVSKLRTTAISNDDLLDLIASIPRKKALLVDACHSGAAMTVAPPLPRPPTDTLPAIFQDC